MYKIGVGKGSNKLEIMQVMMRNDDASAKSAMRISPLESVVKALGVLEMGHFALSAKPIAASKDKRIDCKEEHHGELTRHGSPDTGNISTDRT